MVYFLLDVYYKITRMHLSLIFIYVQYESSVDCFHFSGSLDRIADYYSDTFVSGKHGSNGFELDV